MRTTRAGRFTTACVVLAIACPLAARADATGVFDYPMEVVKRPLVLPSGVLSVGAGAWFWSTARASGASFTNTTGEIFGAYGLGRGLEVSGSLDLIGATARTSVGSAMAAVPVLSAGLGMSFLSEGGLRVAGSIAGAVALSGFAAAFSVGVAVRWTLGNFVALRAGSGLFGANNTGNVSWALPLGVELQVTPNIAVSVESRFLSFDSEENARGLVPIRGIEAEVVLCPFRNVDVVVSALIPTPGAPNLSLGGSVSAAVRL